MRKKIEHQETTSSQDASLALLDAARDIFLNEGIRGLSVRRVAEQAGCTTMAVYSQFKRKDGILRILFDEGFEMLSLAQHAVDAKLENEDKVLAICHTYRATASSYPHHYALMLGQHSGEYSPSKASQSKAMKTLDFLIQSVSMMRSMKNQTRQASEELANALFAFCHGWVSLERAGFLAASQENQRVFEGAVLSLTVGFVEAKRR